MFNKISSVEGLFCAWNEFKKGKEAKTDVQKFFLELENNLFSLCEKIATNKYRHSRYIAFFVCDPKLRSIHKAEVSDRVLHHSIVRNINDIFEKSFIFDSYSSRKGKGTHRAIKRLHKLGWKLSHNNTKTVWVLKCDIKKFFDSVNHEILIDIVRERLKDDKLMLLIGEIIHSYNFESGTGIPLGNLTSQLFSNIYLNKFDQFVKRELRIRNYIRYADDFVILEQDKNKLEKLLPVLKKFLERNLKLQIHPEKITLRKFHQGIDFLGYVVFPFHITLRTKTKRRMFKKIRKKYEDLRRDLVSEESFNQSLQSYLGILTHCKGHKIKEKLMDFN